MSPVIYICIYYIIAPKNEKTPKIYMYKNIYKLCVLNFGTHPRGIISALISKRIEIEAPKRGAGNEARFCR